ncbi:hypothetical protein [Rhodococcus sp. HS-D2]|uniref:hypothetical protein n=1 Tax=Rhodococcus sp. HS-D2 TaxID=1384636 RepID=UPI000AC32255|nr:hypothetical protein [Rhodococcus sp. HS-D2]
MGLFEDLSKIEQSQKAAQQAISNQAAAKQALAPQVARQARTLLEEAVRFLSGSNAPCMTAARFDLYAPQKLFRNSQRPEPLGRAWDLRGFWLSESVLLCRGDILNRDVASLKKANIPVVGNQETGRLLVISPKEDVRYLEANQVNNLADAPFHVLDKSPFPTEYRFNYPDHFELPEQKRIGILPDGSPALVSYSGPSREDTSNTCTAVNLEEWLKFSIKRLITGKIV